MFCPQCGAKLIPLAQGSFGPADDDRKIKEIAELSEKFKKALMVNGRNFIRDLPCMWYLQKSIDVVWDPWILL